MSYPSAEAREKHLAQMRAAWRRRFATDPDFRLHNRERCRKWHAAMNAPRPADPELAWQQLLGGRRYDRMGVAG